MVIWPDEVSNEGHVYAALDRAAGSAVEGPFQHQPVHPASNAGEELAMEDDLRWLEEAARNGCQAAMIELAELEY